MESVLEAGPVVRTNQLDYDDEVLYKATQYLYDHVRHRNTQPFALTVSFTHPHDPYAMTKDFWDLYEGVDIPLPKTAAIPHDKQDPHSQRLLKCMDLFGREMPEERVLAARRAYFAACTYVDSQVGKLLRTLDNCGLADDTIIVFTGDHGDMLGERGLWYKMSWYEMSARVPMLIHAPNRFQPKRVKENVSTMDLLPTFVGLVGSTVDDRLPIDGVSLMPYITGEAGLKTDTVLGEYMGEGTLSPLVMIRRGRWKFVYSPIDPPQLFDVVADPLESVNLAAGYSGALPPRGISSITKAGKPAATDVLNLYNLGEELPTINVNGALPSPPATPEISPMNSINANSVPSLIGSFLNEVASRWDFDAITADVVTSQRARRLVHSALMKGEGTTWDYAPPVDASQIYVRNQRKAALDDFEFLSRWPRVSQAVHE